MRGGAVREKDMSKIYFVVLKLRKKITFSGRRLKYNVIEFFS